MTLVVLVTSQAHQICVYFVQDSVWTLEMVAHPGELQAREFIPTSTKPTKQPHTIFLIDDLLKNAKILFCISSKQKNKRLSAIAG